MTRKPRTPMASSSFLCALSFIFLLVTTATAQQGPGGGPPPNKSTPVEAGELRETWNDRASQGPPVGAFPEFDGWSMGTAMPLARSEHAVAEMDGKIWVL